VLQDIKRSTFAFGPVAFRSLSPPEARFRQNVWESGTENRVSKYGWLFGACRGVTYRSFDGVPGQGLRSRDFHRVQSFHRRIAARSVRKNGSLCLELRWIQEPTRNYSEHSLHLFMPSIRRVQSTAINALHLDRFPFFLDNPNVISRDPLRGEK
jgi:hypothetical protein